MRHGADAVLREGFGETFLTLTFSLDIVIPGKGAPGGSRSLHLVGDDLTSALPFIRIIARTTADESREGGKGC